MVSRDGNIWYAINQMVAVDVPVFFKCLDGTSSIEAPLLMHYT